MKNEYPAILWTRWIGEYQQVIHRQNGNFKAKTVSKSADGVDKIVDKSKNFIGYFVYIIFLKLIL